MVFLRLPEAVRITQFLHEDRTPDIRVTHEELTEARGQVDEHTEPRVRLSAYERWDLKLVSKYVRRVELPPDMRAAT
jgi:hypothetical protein